MFALENVMQCLIFSMIAMINLQVIPSVICVYFGIVAAAALIESTDRRYTHNTRRLRQHQSMAARAVRLCPGPCLIQLEKLLFIRWKLYFTRRMNRN